MNARLQILVFSLFVISMTACSAEKPVAADFQPPDHAAPPDTALTGTLSVTRKQLQIEEFVRADFIPPLSDSFPDFSFDYVSDGTNLIPARRGLIPVRQSRFDLLLGPGRIWQDRAGVVKASLPFTLMSREANCTHNGLLKFTLVAGKEGNKQSGSILINQETCHFLKFDMWGAVSVVYTPTAMPLAQQVIADFRDEVAARIPSRPYADFARDYPQVDLARFSAGLPDNDDLSTRGIYFEGVHYSDCRTRAGAYPYCGQMMLTSFSTAKTAFPAVVMMALAQEYGLDVYQEKIADYLAEAAIAKGDWREVTFGQTGDMATGNFIDPSPAADQLAPGFFNEIDAAEKLRASFDLPNGARAGEKVVYLTSDTYVLVSAMDAYLRARNAEITDSFEYLVRNVLKPLQIAPDVYVSRRTRENGIYNSGRAFGGYGMFWNSDSIVKVARLLTHDEGKIQGRQVLHPQALAATMQQDPDDRGLPMNFYGFYYNNGTWALPARLLGEQYHCDPWVTVMTGLSGIRVIMMPNGLIFYFFNDAQAFPLADQIEAANQVKPFCS
ncbi:MAG: hypothetical protein O7F71_07185 [Gammaproteobacteria bacterium]|nr:hypothetical protein [Gammaproteobacteria bacterium]